MSISDTDLPPHWQYYSECSREAHLGYADDFGNGREEQLNETLRFIESGKPFTDDVRDKLDRLPQNRAKKHTRLRKHIVREAVMRHPQQPVYTLKLSVISYFDDIDAPINHVHSSLAPALWLIECKLAEGESYASVADSIGISLAAVKMRVSRWRATVRAKITA